MIKRGGFAAVAAAMVLSGCAGASVQKDVKYKDVMELRAAYIASGVVKDPKCDEGITQDALGQWGWQSVNCGLHTSLIHFNSQKSMDDFKARNPMDPGELHVVGPNWLIDAPEFEAQEIQKLLGGSTS